MAQKMPIRIRERAIATGVRRYIEGHGYNHYIAEHQSPGAAELIHTDKILYLLPGERLVIRQASASANDVLALYAHGYKIHSAFIPGGE